MRKRRQSAERAQPAPLDASLEKRLQEDLRRMGGELLDLIEYGRGERLDFPEPVDKFLPEVTQFLKSPDGVKTIFGWSQKQELYKDVALLEARAPELSLHEVRRGIQTMYFHLSRLEDTAMQKLGLGGDGAIPKGSFAAARTQFLGSRF